MSFVLCDIKFSLFFLMSDQNFVLSPTLCLNRTYVLSREKYYFCSPE